MGKRTDEKDLNSFHVYRLERNLKVKDVSIRTKWKPYYFIQFITLVLLVQITLKSSISMIEGDHKTGSL